MRTLLLCGKQWNQVALANKIHSRFDLCGIVFESRKKRGPRHSTPFRRLMEYVLDRTIFVTIRSSWTDLLAYYEKIYPHVPPVPVIDVPRINAAAAVAFVKRLNPDLIAVSGTGMVKEEILSMKPAKGIINLHTGLSPYLKGGPNCTNWCLAESKFHLIGNTVMWIDKGIDTGKILASDFVPLLGHENLKQLHLSVMEHAHELYLGVMDYLSQCSELPPGIPQDEIGTGVTYYNKDWGMGARAKVVLNILTGRYQKGIRDAERARYGIRTLALKPETRQAGTEVERDVRGVIVQPN